MRRYGCFGLSMNNVCQTGGLAVWVFYCIFSSQANGVAGLDMRVQ